MPMIASYSKSWYITEFESKQIPEFLDQANMIQGHFFEAQRLCLDLNKKITIGFYISCFFSIVE